MLVLLKRVAWIIIFFLPAVAAATRTGGGDADTQPCAGHASLRSAAARERRAQASERERTRAFFALRPARALPSLGRRRNSEPINRSKRKTKKGEEQAPKRKVGWLWRHHQHQQQQSLPFLFSHRCLFLRLSPFFHLPSPLAAINKPLSIPHVHHTCNSTLSPQFIIGRKKARKNG